MRVLLVTDDELIASKLSALLGANGHAPTWCRVGTDALRARHGTDVALLDLGMSDVDGVALLSELSGDSGAPVLAFSSYGDEASVVQALRGGADDYLVKPIRQGELLARIEAVTRRAMASAPADRTVRLGKLTINLDARIVRVGERQVPLTTKEFDVLAVFARNAGAAVSRRQIMNEVWGDVNLAVSRSLDVHMTALRTKLACREMIHTIRGYGYRFERSPGAE
ncbi:MAG: response regulator transcription factor [Pseudonocardia sp.]|nr:response regulator transcription factor [Pseudonocardia sp.]